MNLTNLDTNESIFQLLEFTGNIMTHEWNNCLVDGCYSLTFDSCLPLAAGEGLDYNVFVNGLSILENALITYSDDYAMTIQFGINSTCLNTTCNANFTIIAGDNPGEVLINNLSELSGQANYSWTFGDGNGNLGNNSVYTFSQNGTYEICLTASNNLCEDTYCSSISVINSTCNNTGVLVQLSSDYQLPNMSDLLTVLISIEDNAIGQYDLEVVPFNTYPLSFCIPNGCYTIELISNNPLTALGIFAEVISNNQLISESSLLNGSTYSATEFGINTNCEDAVMETPLSELDIYPNPSTSQVFIKLSKEYVVNDIFLFDNFGRKVMYINPNDRSVMVEHLSSGIYYLQIITQKGVMTRAIEVIH
jgi:PKD repeat protein